MRFLNNTTVTAEASTAVVRPLITGLMAVLVVLTASGLALAADRSDGDDQPAPAPTVAPAPMVAEAEVSPADRGDTDTVTTTTTVSATSDEDAEAADEEEGPSPISASLGISTDIGLGTFVTGDQNQDAFSMTFSPSITYSLGDGMSLKAAISGTVYAVNDYSTPLADGQFLFSDMYFQFGHGAIYANEDLGLTINGALRVYLPTSLGSQFQNRVLSLRPQVGMSWKFGPVSLSMGLNLTKYFMTSSNASIDCDAFKDPAQCRDGRDSSAGGSLANVLGPTHGGFASERNGGDVYLPGAGATSFNVGWSFGATWTIIENLDLSFGLAGVHSYSVSSYDITSTSSQHAKAGRSQTDRLISSLSLSYQIHKHVGVGLSFGTDTIRPFGSDGKDLVILDTERAPDNISSLGISVTGTL